jgi:hypothetical protein
MNGESSKHQAPSTREAPNPKLQLEEVEQTNAVFVAGQLNGMAYHLNANALEKFLETAPNEFRYGSLCRAAIAFRRAIDAAWKENS